MELTSTEKERTFERIIPLIENEDITYEKVKMNPILRPLAEKNNSYLTNERNIIRALKELDSTQLSIKEVIDSNPDIYESTIIVAKLERYKLFASQVIHGLLSQKDLLKDCIWETLKINEIEYGLKNEEVEDNFRPNIEQEPVKKVPEIKVPSITYFDEVGNAIEEVKEEKSKLSTEV